MSEILKKAVFLEGFESGYSGKLHDLVTAKVVDVTGWQEVFNAGLRFGRYAADVRRLDWRGVKGVR